MFEARLLKSSILKKVLEAIKDLCSAAVFDCDDNGIELQAMSQSQVCLVSLILHADRLDKYICDCDVSIGIVLGSMSKILECGGEQDTVTIKAQDNADSVTFVFESQEKVSSYEMKLMDLDLILLDISETKSSCTIRLPSVEFAKICHHLSQFGKFMVISCTEEGVKFSTTGDIGSANVELVETASVDKEEEAVIIKMDEPVRLAFSCQYLNHIINATSLSPQVQLSLSAVMPLIVEYRIPDFGPLRYFLAPKKSNDSDLL